MAKKTYTWPDGSKNHTIPWETHLANVQLSGRSVVGLLPSVTTQPKGGAFTPPSLPPAQTYAESHGATDSSSATAPQPVDPSVLNAQLVANRNIAIGKGEAAYQEGNLGFDLGYNPDGSINAADPYSRAALFQLSHERSRLGNTNSYAAAGQLYSGALTNAQNEADRVYAQNEAGNRLAYQRGLHGIQTGLLNTTAAGGSGVSDADFNALLKATYPGS